MKIYLYKELCFTTFGDRFSEHEVQYAVDFVIDVKSNGIVEVIKKPNLFYCPNYYFNIRDAIHEIENFYDNDYDYGGIDNFTTKVALEKVKEL